MRHHNRLARVALLAAATMAIAPPAAAQEADDVPLVIPRERMEAMQDERLQVEPPPEPVIVPPPAQPAPPTEQAAATTELVQSSLDTATRTLTNFTELELDAIAHAARAEAEVARAEARLDARRRTRDRAVRVLASKRDEVRRRAVAAYTGARSVKLDSLLEAEDMNALSRRVGFVDAVVDQDGRVLREYAETKAAAEADVDAGRSEVEAATALATQARRLADEAIALRLRQQGTVDALRHGGTVAMAGFTFPVDEPFTFADTFGAPRMTGTEFEHTHQGTDIFAPHGTPLRAVERGVVTRMGSDTLGGRKLWLVGTSGTRYYYAHLSGYAAGLADGQVVEAGAPVGFVGNTGNARTTPPHLHFECHPGGGAAVNPYPLLQAAAAAARAVG